MARKPYKTTPLEQLEHLAMLRNSYTRAKAHLAMIRNSYTRAKAHQYSLLLKISVLNLVQLCTKASTKLRRLFQDGESTYVDLQPRRQSRTILCNITIDTSCPGLTVSLPCSSRNTSLLSPQVLPVGVHVCFPCSSSTTAQKFPFPCSLTKSKLLEDFDV